MAESGGLFIIDAETNDLSQFNEDIVQEGSCTIAASVSAKNNGSYGLLLTGDGTNDRFSGTYDLGAGGVQAEIYARCYIYIPSTLRTTGAWYNVFVMWLANGGHICRMGFQANASAVPLRWSVYLGATAITSTTNFSMDAWHRLELHYVKEADTGGIEAWVDGTSIGTDLDQTTTQDVRYCEFGCTSNSNPLTDEHYFHLDDIKVDTSPVGAYSDASAGTSVPILAQYYRRLRV